MPTISRDTILTLETYSRERNSFRAKVLEHKATRIVHVGPHVTLIFEDELTIRYQIQEMLRAERIFEEQGIQDEIDAYSPLVPDGRNWKATMMIEYEDVAERERALARLLGIEKRTWVRVTGGAKVYAIADEDLERETEGKTSAVHFLRFELSEAMAAAAKTGAAIAIGIDHAEYAAEVTASPAVRDSLARDLA